MIMRPGQQLLLPASPVFIWCSLRVALLLNIAPNMAGMGRVAWLPDFLALTLVPRDARLATQVRELQIAGLAGDVRSVALWLGGGDRSVMAVEPLQPLQPLTPASAASR